MYTYTPVYIYIYLHFHINIYTFICGNTYIYIYKCIYAYTFPTFFFPCFFCPGGPELGARSQWGWPKRTGSDGSVGGPSTRVLMATSLTGTTVVVGSWNHIPLLKVLNAFEDVGDVGIVKQKSKFFFKFWLNQQKLRRVVVVSVCLELLKLLGFFFGSLPLKIVWEESFRKILWERGDGSFNPPKKPVVSWTKMFFPKICNVSQNAAHSELWRCGWSPIENERFSNLSC